MVNTKKPTPIVWGFKAALKQWAGFLVGSVLVAFAANLGLAQLLIAMGLATLVFVAIGGKKHPFMVGPAAVFLPALLIYARSYETLTIGTPAWQFRLGGLLVAIWISGLVYVVLASIVRFVGIKRIRRLFSPQFGNLLVAVILLTALPRVFLFTMREPLLAQPEATYKFYVIAIVALLTFALVTMLVPRGKTAEPWALLLGLCGGLLATLILDAVEILWLSKDIGSTLLLGRFNAGLFAAPLTVFQDIPAQFGFWGYLHFDWESILLVVPFSFVALAEHIGAMTRFAQKTAETDAGLHADQTILAEGVAVLVGGMVSGYPLTISDAGVKIATEDQRPHPLTLTLLAAITFGLGVFTPVSAVLMALPLPLIGGLLLGWLASRATVAIGHFATSLKDEPQPGATAMALLIMALGFVMATLEFVGDVLGQDSWRIMIGATPLPSTLIIIMAAFVVNLMVPRHQE